MSAGARARGGDPTTSGGLPCNGAPGAVEAVLASVKQQGFDAAMEIGEITAMTGGAKLQVRGGMGPYDSLIALPGTHESF